MIDVSDDRQAAYTVPELVGLFNVHEDTVLRWAREGLMGAFRTPSKEGQGHWRFLAHKVREQMRGDRARDDHQDAAPVPLASPQAPPPGRGDGGCPAWVAGDCECTKHCIA